MDTTFQRRTEELVQQALDLPREEWPGFLAEACAGDDALRAEVERLLYIPEVELDTFLGHSALEAPQLAAGAPWAAPVETLPARVGPYAIVRRIGEGGMGVVYEARQEHPHRLVALKVIRPGLTSRSMLRRFQHEAEVLAHLQHPGIAHIYEAGEGEVIWTGPDGTVIARATQPFFAMEYVRGEPLNDYAARRNLTTPQKLELVARVCDAIHHAHLKGVIHRDLKPGNILVCEEVLGAPSSTTPHGSSPRPDAPNPDAAVPKILDFGVARLTDAEAAITLQTDPGQLIGTVPYMSPEQVLGDSRQIDARSDVYSLGVILYEILAGRLPYDVRGRPLPEAARIIREDEPSRLSSANTAFRGDVETIVSKAIEKEKSRRYSSASELAADIRRHLRDEPLMARPTSALYHFRKFARRNRAIVIGAAAAVAALIVGSVVSVYFAVSESRQRTVADANADRAKRMAYRSNLSAALAAMHSFNGALARLSLDEAPPELRGWEWDYLDYRLRRGVRELRLGLGRIRGLETSADGRSIIVGTTTGELCILDPQSGSVVQDLGRRDGPVMALVLHPEGSTLAVEVSGAAPRVELVSLADGSVRWRRSGAALLTRWAFHPEGRLVALGSLDDRVDIHDVGSGELVKSLYTPRALESGAGFSRDGRRVIAALDYGIGVGLDYDDGRVLWETAMTHFDCSPKRDVILTGSPGTAAIRDASDVERPLALPKISGIVAGVALNPLGTLAALTLGPGAVFIYDVDSGQPVSALSGDPRVDWATFSRDGLHLVGISGESLETWDAVEGDAPFHVSTVHGPNFHAVFGEDGRRIICGVWGGVKAWDGGTGEELWTCIMGRPDAYRLAMDPAQRHVAAALTTRQIALIDAEDGRLIRRSDPLAARAADLAWDGTALIVLGADGMLRRLAAETMAVETEWSAGPSAACLSICGAAGLAAIGFADGRVDVVETSGWQPRRQLRTGEVEVTAVVFNGDGTRLAAATADGAVAMFPIDSPAAPIVYRSGGIRVHCAAFTPDGTRLAAGMDDGSVRILDTRSGDEWSSFRDGPGSVRALEFVCGGRTLQAVHPPDFIAYETSRPGVAVGVRDRARRMRAVVDRVHATHGLCEKVVAALEDDPALSEADRAVALRMARARGNHPAWQNNDAWGIVMYSDRSQEQYRLALSLIEEVCRTCPGESSYMNTLGVAQYRMRDYRAARTTFLECLKLHQQSGSTPDPSDLLFLGMAEYQLGDAAEARQRLEQARALLTPVSDAMSKEMRNFLREAQRLILPP